MQLPITICSAAELRAFCLAADAQTAEDYYCIVAYDGIEAAVYFGNYAGVDLESPCVLRRVPCFEHELVDYVKERYAPAYWKQAYHSVRACYREGYLYEIENPQTASFLPARYTILAVLNEAECIDWMLAQEARQALQHSSAKRLAAYPDVFLELDALAQSSDLLYRICHNCAQTSASFCLTMLCFDDDGKVQEDAEFLCIDEDSFLFLDGIFAAHIPDFDCHSDWNPIKSAQFSEIAKDIRKLCDQLLRGERTSLTTQCMKDTYLYLWQHMPEQSDWDAFLAQRYTLTAFCNALLWYYEAYLRFAPFDAQERMLNLHGW